ncbi:MAG: hypothetical protein ACREQ1_15630, partial [Woeseiaceae bacterium]
MSRDRHHANPPNTGRVGMAGVGPIPRALHALREISVIRTACLGWRLRCTRVLVYPRVHIGTETGSSIEAARFLHLGRRWQRCAFLPSQFNMFRGAR